MARETRSMASKSSKQADIKKVPAKVNKSAPKRPKRGAKKEIESKKEDEPMTLEEQPQGSDDESGCSSADEPSPVIESMALNRPRRAKAGSKMPELMAKADQDDAFYKRAYGGFSDDEFDDDYKSSENSDEEEEEDSDLD